MVGARYLVVVFPIMIVCVMAHKDFPKCQSNCGKLFIYLNNHPLGK